MTTRITQTRDRLTWLAGSLRRGLPGDNTPRTERDARDRCPHRELQHIPLTTDRYWLDGKRAPFATEYLTRTDAAGPHTCVGGWAL